MAVLDGLPRQHGGAASIRARDLARLLPGVRVSPPLVIPAVPLIAAVSPMRYAAGTCP